MLRRIKQSGLTAILLVLQGENMGDVYLMKCSMVGQHRADNKYFIAVYFLRRMAMKKLMMLLMCFLYFAGIAPAVVVNVDFGWWDQNVKVPTRLYTGQGALHDVGKDYWNHAGRGWEGQLSVSNLKASDGITATTIGITFADVTFDYGPSDANAVPPAINLLLCDGRRPDAGGSEGFTISGLNANADYKLYLYGGNLQAGLGTVFTANGVTGQTTGFMGTTFVEGGNYVILEVKSDASGNIVGTFAPLTGQTNAAFNGFQIAEVIVVRGQVHTPAPTDWNGMVEKTLPSISWYSPEQDKNGVTVDDPNLVVGGYDVWFGTTEPNDVTGAPVSTNQPGKSYSVSLNYSTTYYWRVDTRAIWDVNSITGNFTDTIKGPVWRFTTRPSYLTPVLTFNNVITTQAILPATLSATVTGNSDAIRTAIFTLQTTDYQFPVGANAVVTNTTTNYQNPTATLTTDMAGTYKVKLVVWDGTTTLEKIMEVMVYADACAAKKASPGGWTANYYDRNGNCLVQLSDFAVLAQNWLNDTTMKVQETY
jgi:hypothetical protein